MTLDPSTVYVGSKRFYSLVPSQLELLIAQANIYGETGWMDEVKHSGIFFDLSRVEWVDLGALVQLTLLVESAVCSGIRVTIALPLPDMHGSESTDNPQTSEPAALLQSRLDRRRRALSFLGYLQFANALRFDHLPSAIERPSLLLNYSSSHAQNVRTVLLDVQEPEFQRVPADREYLYKYVFPLRWISIGNTAGRSDIEKFFESVVADSQRGLEVLDASVITNVFLYELIDNVAVHAGQSASALVAAWATPSSVPANLEPSDYLLPERPYIEWLSLQSHPFVQIFVGDSGVGLPQKLLPHYRQARSNNEARSHINADDTVNTMLWAFDRWSSSKDSNLIRGTRGLYRVDRVVKKYQGIATLRSANHLVGLDHGGPSFDRSVYDLHNNLSYMPGTLLTLRVPASRRLMQPRKIADEEQRSLIVTVVDLGELTSNGISKESLEVLRSKLKDTTGSPRCVVGLITSLPADKSAVDNALRQAIELRHPGALVLAGFPGGWDFSETIINSLNEESRNNNRHRESASEQHFEVWDPVLVVGPGDRFAWVGAEENTGLILDHLVMNGGLLSYADMSAILTDDSICTEVMRTLRNDTHLVRINDNGDVQLLPTLSAIADGVSGTIANGLAAHITRNLGGVLSEGPYRTPSLAIVTKWLDIDLVLRATYGHDLCIFALALLVQKLTLPSIPNAVYTAVLTDSGSSVSNVRSLCSHLGITRMEVLSVGSSTSFPAGMHLFKPGVYVIVHCDVVASGETAKQCLRQVIRDGAIPIAISCLFDIRQTGSPIEVWGVEIPVIALVRIPLVLPSTDHSNANIDPITRQLEESRVRSTDYPIPRSTLFDIVQEHNALHISHIGRPIGRHFSLYIDASWLIDHPVISAAFDSVISKWIGHEASSHQVPDGDKFELWHPEPEPKPSAPARRFAEAISARRNDITVVRAIRREAAYGQWYFAENKEGEVTSPSVLIVDWGALTGTTVMQMIRLAAQAGARRILVCICLSQLPAAEESFLTLLSSLTVERTARESGQLQFHVMSEAARSTAAPKHDTVEVSVKFLSRFSITAYDLDECPLCQQIRRLEQKPYPTKLLERFVNEQERRLRLRTREEIVNRVPVDIDGFLIDGPFARKVAEHRDALAAALGSTCCRQLVVEQLHQMFEGLATQTAESWQDAGALMHLLTVEPYWLRRPPLYFPLSRDTIASIALKIATNADCGISQRLNAITVLRSSSKLLFARQFAYVFEAVTNSSELLAHLLYGAFTYLMRSYHASLYLLTPLRDALVGLSAKVEDRSLQVDGEVAETVRQLWNRSEVEYAKAHARGLTQVEAWALLRAELGPSYQPHKPAPYASMHMQPGPDLKYLDELVREAESRTGLIEMDWARENWFKSLNSLWTVCQEFLDRYILPRLAVLRTIIEGQDARFALSPDTCDRLITMIDLTMIKKTPVAESEFSKVVEQLSQNPRGNLSKRNWEFYKSEAMWFRDELLRAQDNTNTPARLVSFIRSAPVQLRTACRLALDGVWRNMPKDVELHGQEAVLDCEYYLFCTEQLARDAIAELLYNIPKHLDEKRSGPVGIWLECSREETTASIVFRITNSGTRLVDHGGQGLKTIGERLNRFGATLNRLSPQEHYTFAVEIVFQEGRI